MPDDECPIDHVPAGADDREGPFAAPAPVVLTHDDGREEVLLLGVDGIDAHIIGPPGAADLFRRDRDLPDPAPEIGA